MENFQVYRDIQARTGGDIYIGVVGPVRTGKSTFIRRFMELVALPQMSDTKQAEIRDQLPLSGSGKIITTAETKSALEKVLNSSEIANYPDPDRISSIKDFYFNIVLNAKKKDIFTVRFF